MNHIFLVEDDADIRESLAGLLELEGYTVSCAADGDEALEMLKAGLRPCLILLDVMMPSMKGDEVARILRNDPELCSIPIAALTAATKVDIPDVVTILKPFQLDDLLEHVRRLCRYKTARDQLPNVSPS